MPRLLTFSRNRCTSVGKIDESTWASTCRLQDTLTDAVVKITVSMPDMEITHILAEVERSELPCPDNPSETLAKAIGVRVGPGMTRIFEGLFEQDDSAGQLAFMLEECCHGLILAFTRETLRDAPSDPEEALNHYRNMVKKNIRLYNRCAAFAPGSPVVEGIDPPS